MNQSPPQQEMLQALMEQFIENLQATVGVSQSVESLQSEMSQRGTVRDRQIALLQEKVAELSILVQGEGMGDSLYKSFIELKSKVDNIERHHQDYVESGRENRRIITPWKIALWSILASVMTMVANVILSPIFTKIFK